MRISDWSSDVCSSDLLGKDSPVAVMLSAARSATLESMRSEVAGRAVSPADPKLIRYLQASMGALPHEILRALFLDGPRRVIGDEQMQNGTIGQLTVHARVIFRRALELNDTGVILVPNHTNGHPPPSRGDNTGTKSHRSIGPH